MMLIFTRDSESRRDVIWVAYRVQSSKSRGNGIFVRLSSREDFPEL